MDFILFMICILGIEVQLLVISSIIRNIQKEEEEYEHEK